MSAMSDLFVAIGDFWQLGDDPSPYKLRLQAFMVNRIAFNPLYSEFYAVAKSVSREQQRRRRRQMRNQTAS